MNVLYSGDANIRDGVLISSLSLARNVKEPLRIFVLTASLEQDGEIKTALEKSFATFLEGCLKKYNSEHAVTIIDISEKFRSHLPSANLNTRFTPFCMLRLFADELEELPERLLYLDNDVICCKDPSDFYYQDISDVSLCGVLDHYGSWFFRRKFYKRDYLNSGVLLLNLSKIRSNGLFRKAREMCAVKRMFMPDQSALNKLCEDKRICPRAYNEQRILREDTVFRHFTTSFRFFPYFHTVSVKPWNVEAMHNVLKLFEYDDLLNEYLESKVIYQGEFKYEYK